MELKIFPESAIKQTTTEQILIVAWGIEVIRQGSRTGEFSICLFLNSYRGMGIEKAWYSR